jgi:Tol biopolymer transport system component
MPAAGRPRRFPRRAAPSPAARCIWGPRREILYQRTTNRNYHILDPATNEERPLLSSESAGWIFGPRSSPDGTQLAVYWNRSPLKEGTGTWLLPFAAGAVSGAPRRLQAGFTWPLGWSADGRLLYLFEQAPAPRVLVIPAAGGQATVLVDFPSQRVGLLPALSPDRKTVIYSAHAINSDVWLAEDTRASPNTRSK